jgi:hypothetical protein
MFLAALALTRVEDARDITARMLQALQTADPEDKGYREQVQGGGLPRLAPLRYGLNRV